MGKKYLRVPELVVGFDTETTGLDVSCERAISYGICEYRFGRLVASEQFFVVPDRPISEGAKRVHGLGVEEIEAKRSTEKVLSVADGLSCALAMLRDYHERGAFVVGANVVRFDLAMLQRSHEAVLGLPARAAGFDVDALRIIDVIDHDLTIEPDRSKRPRRSLELLCRHYGVMPGGHDALGDARAAVDVFLEQVAYNNAGQMALDLAAGVLVRE